MSKRKILSALIALVMMLVLVPAFTVNTFATVEVTPGWTAIGTCEYKIEGTGANKTLTVRPACNGSSGILPDGYTKANDWPWNGERNNIKSAAILPGVIAGNSTARMFYDMGKLTSLDLSGLDTSNVTNMNLMFYGAKMKSIDLSGLDTSKVTTMVQMFYSCTNLTTIDVSGFNTSNVTSMEEMFAQCEKLESITGLSSFNNSKLTNMKAMFKLCSSLNSIDLSGFDTSKVENMGYVFCGCSKLTNIDLSGLDTSNVTNMAGMFYGLKLQSLNLSGLDTSNVTNMTEMFAYCKLPDLDLSGLDTSKVTDMSYMFSWSKLQSLDLSGFDTSNVTNMEGMFTSCTLTTIDLSDFDTSKVTNMECMFECASSLKTIIVGDKWNTDLVGETSMFCECNNLVGGAKTAYDENIDEDSYLARVDGGTANKGYLTSVSQYLAAGNVSRWTICLEGSSAYANTSKCEDITSVLASSGLSYQAETDSWIMNNFNYTTIASCGLYSCNSSGTIKITVVGSNSITVCSSGCDSVGIELLDFNSVTICGSGALYASVPDGSGKNSRAISAASEPEFRAAVPGTTTKLYWDSGTYKTASGAIANNVLLRIIPLTVVGTSVDGKTYDGTTDAIIGYLGTLAGVLDGDDVTISSAVAEFTDKNAGKGRAAVVTYVLSGADARYYVVASTATEADIEKRTVVLTSANASGFYDGTVLTNDTVSVSSDGFAEGEGADYCVTGSQAIIGSSSNFFDYTLKSGTIADNYIIVKNYGVLSLVPGITIKAGSASKIYDKTPLTCNAYSITSGKLLPGDIAVLTISGTVTKVGSTANEITDYKIMRGGEDVTAEYTVETEEGTLEVTKRHIILRSGSASKTYDSKALTNSEVTISGDGFLADDGITYEAVGNRSKPGSSKNTIVYEFKAGTDAGNYEVELEEGTLTVKSYSFFTALLRFLANFFRAFRRY